MDFVVVVVVFGLVVIVVGLDVEGLVVDGVVAVAADDPFEVEDVDVDLPALVGFLAPLDVVVPPPDAVAELVVGGVHPGGGPVSMTWFPLLPDVAVVACPDPVAALAVCGVLDAGVAAS